MTGTERAAKIFSRIDELASVTEVPGSITRIFGTAAFLEGAGKVLGWMREAGLEARIDAIGNVRGILRSANDGAKTFVIASHIDTVRNAGRFDGPLGVLAGLDLLEELIRKGQPVPFHIELIAFSDEEGVRFHTTYLGSKVVAGGFAEETLERKDAAGISLREAIEQMDRAVMGESDELSGHGKDRPADHGHKRTADPALKPAADQALDHRADRALNRPGDLMDRLRREAIAPGNWLGYFELHIEQGPVLYERKIPVALVKAIAGQLRAEIIFRGEAGHAGTVPMKMRSDALCAASEFVLELEKMARTSEHGLIATVGKLQIENAAGNTIPGRLVCSLDMRCADESVLSFSYKKIRQICQEIANQRNIVLEWNLMQESGTVVCDTAMNDLLAEAIRGAGYEVLELVSGAGHDAVPISVVSPVCMLFLRCYKGISHNPLENVEREDLAAAIAVMDRVINQLIELWKYQH